MTPIEKNVIVVDELGNEYEATYPKRAKGLVKNGRARFIDDNKICLACPPHTELEETTMSENKKATTNAPEEVTEATVAEQSGTNEQSMLTMEYVLGKIEAIANDTFHIHEAIEAIRQIKSTGPGDVGTQEQTKAIGDIVKARETTNQRLIAFYEKLYDDLKPQSPKLKALETLNELAKNADLDADCAEQLANIFGDIRHYG